MQPSPSNEHHPAHLSNQQVADMLRAAMVEVAVRAGDEALDRLVDEIREALDVETLERMRHERDQMLFTASVLADIAALPESGPTESEEHHGMYL